MIRGIVAAVSYLNTKPMIYGIESARETLRAELLLSPPALCASQFADGTVDVALVPVAEIPSFTDARIITDFCIGACGNVRTVVLLSDSPVEQIDRIYLDAHSKTSVALVKVLADEYWDIHPEWIPLHEYDNVNANEIGAGYLLIGDKVFEHEGKFKYVYDLSDVWLRHTGLPFVFAAWVAHENVADDFIDDLNRAIKYGVDHIARAIDYYDIAYKEGAYDYLTKNIDFNLDSLKRESLTLFWKKALQSGAIQKPG